jgi:MFS family permease
VSGALATFGLLAPLYFAAAMAAMAALLVWRQLPSAAAGEPGSRRVRARLRVTDPRIRLHLATAVGLFVGFSGIQQTLGFQLQDKLQLSGIETAQMTGAALLISAVFTFLIQVTVMQRTSLKATWLIRLGLASLCIAAIIIAASGSFVVLGTGMAFLGAGMGLSMPAIAAGASLAVSPGEQGAAAGLVSSCPAIGFAIGSVGAGGLYQLHGALAPLFSVPIDHTPVPDTYAPWLATSPVYVIPAGRLSVSVTFVACAAPVLVTVIRNVTVSPSAAVTATFTIRYKSPAASRPISEIRPSAMTAPGITSTSSTVPTVAVVLNPSVSKKLPSMLNDTGMVNPSACRA